VGGGNGVGVVIAGAGAAVVASFVDCHNRSWHTEHFVQLVVLEEVVAVVHSTEDYTGQPLGVEDEEVDDVLLRLPSKQSSPVEQVEEEVDLEVKGATVVYN